MSESSISYSEEAMNGKSRSAFMAASRQCCHNSMCLSMWFWQTGYTADGRQWSSRKAANSTIILLLTSTTTNQCLWQMLSQAHLFTFHHHYLPPSVRLSYRLQVIIVPQQLWWNPNCIWKHVDGTQTVNMHKILQKQILELAAWI